MCESTFVIVFGPQDTVPTCNPGVWVLNVILGIFKEKAEHF